MRKAISKKLRFDVFKRDGFHCVYCGAHPPKAILQIDHIHPVSQGGTNQIDNLITSCQPCNLGKSANLLDNIPQSLKDKAEIIAEKEEQIKGYYKVMQDREVRLNEEIIAIGKILDSIYSKQLKQNWIVSIKRFLINLGFYEVKDAAEIARNKYPYGGKRTFLYFCGICLNRMRAE